jgi:hypothetical protein
MRAKDPRWIVLTEDGRYSTVGRHREPDEADIVCLEETMRSQGLAGWLAILSQSAYAAGLPDVVHVRPIGTPANAFETGRDRLLEGIRNERRSS